MTCGFSLHGNAYVIRHNAKSRTTENWKRSWLGDSRVDHFISRHWFSWRHNLHHSVCLLLNGTRVEFSFVFIFSRLWWRGGVCFGTVQRYLTDPDQWARYSGTRSSLLLALQKRTRNREVVLSFRPHVNIWIYRTNCSTLDERGVYTKRFKRTRFLFFTCIKLTGGKAAGAWS
jgi:hypothetical protein